jgi:hypothetical protein
MQQPQLEISKERARRGTTQLRHESVEHRKREVAKIEVEKIATQLRMAKRNYADSLALPVGFAILEYLLALNYPTTTKSSTYSKIQMTGWSTT